MTLDQEYDLMVNALFKDGDALMTEVTPFKLSLNHISAGLAGEIGEIVDAIKKHTMYNKELDIPNLKEELGDLEFFLAKLRIILGFTREEILLGNKSKLAVRYSSGSYSNKEAHQRADKI
jgi:NTP pyrophosphatase (non-canonical NTP hydrolase)